MYWDITIRSFEFFMKMERQLSPHSVAAYKSDIFLFTQYLKKSDFQNTPESIRHEHISGFLKWLSEHNISATSQARIISGIKSFYKYLLMENLITCNPMELIEAPRIGKKLPEVMDESQVDRILAAVNTSFPEGKRNRAMLETLYSCGLRVNELVNLKLSDLFFESGFIQVIGKGNKQRLVPISNTAIKFITDYKNKIRNKVKVVPGYENFLFLGQRGKPLSTVSVFLAVKASAARAGLSIHISPHTFRHSFATHLVQNGADLRAVQEMMGHETITSTEVYTHMNNKDLHKTISKFHPLSSLCQSN